MVQRSFTQVDVSQPAGLIGAQKWASLQSKDGRFTWLKVNMSSQTSGRTAMTIKAVEERLKSRDIGVEELKDHVRALQALRTKVLHHVQGKPFSKWREQKVQQLFDSLIGSILPRLLRATRDEETFQETCKLFDAATINLPVDSQGNTALHIAVEKKWPEAAHYLINHGANIHALNKAKESPLTKFSQALRNLNKRQFSSLAKKQRAFLDVCDEYSSVINGPIDKEGNTALHMAVKLGFHDSLYYLLSLGADCLTENTAKQTPYPEHGVLFGRLASPAFGKALAKLMLEKRLDEPLDQEGNTLLHIAYKRQNTELADKLTAAGAHEDVTNKKNLIPRQMSPQT